MSAKFTFDDVLRQLGHFYFESSVPEDSPTVTERVRHMAKSIDPDGAARAICSGETITGSNESWLVTHHLMADVNCVSCREVLGLKKNLVTKRSLLIECVHIVMNLEQLFLEAMYTNSIRSEGTDPINPDPDGELAEMWEEHVNQIKSMLGRFEPTMLKHAAMFGWPEELEQED